MLLMKQSTMDDLDRLDTVLAKIAKEQEEADTLLLRIAESGDRGSKAELCRRLGIKPQSLPIRLTAARNRIMARRAAG